jgi:ABC-type multidrug transport system ATPase subunit
MLEAINLTKTYEDGVVALDHLNLDVKCGEVYCLLGANGAGKTTTINPFPNFIPPTTSNLGSLISLVIWLIALFAAACVRFLKYDVR